MSHLIANAKSRKTLDRLAARLSSAEVNSDYFLEPFVFICGKFHSRRRDYLQKHIRKTHSNVHVFYAEDAWNHVRHLPLSALQMESYLAKIADMVIIIVESVGTAAELGAFALNDDLRGKIFAVVDEEYKDDESFINTGPLRWLTTDSRFKPAFVQFEPMFEVVAELDQRLELLKPPFRMRSRQTVTRTPRAREKHLMYLLCHIASMIGPADASDFSYVISKILADVDDWQLNSLLGLATSLELTTCRGTGGEAKYSRNRASGRALGTKIGVNANRERARVLDAVIATNSDTWRERIAELK